MKIYRIRKDNIEYKEPLFICECDEKNMSDVFNKICDDDKIQNDFDTRVSHIDSDYIIKD